MRPRSFITQKFFEDLLLLLPCLLLLSPQLLWPAHLEWRSIMGGKEFTQDHRARERAFAYLFNRALLSHLYPFSYCLSWPTHRPCLNTMLLLDFPSSQFKVYSQYIYDQFNEANLLTNFSFLVDGGEKGVPYNIRKTIQSHGRREQEKLVPTKKEQSFLGQKDSGTQLFIDSEHELVGWWCPFIQLTSVRGTARQSPALGTRLVSIHS